MNSGKIGFNYCVNQMFCKFGLSTNSRTIVVNQMIQKENNNEQSRRNSKENQGLGA
jgi:hypothetical protein